MTLTALSLVLLSAVTHAYWNFLLKRSAGGELFIGLSKLAEALIFLPAFLVVALPAMPRDGFVALLVMVATVGVAANYIFLGLAYRHGDLSLTYPIQRGGTLLFLPLLAWMTIGERVDAIGACGLLAILTGVVMLQLPALNAGSLRRLSSHVRNRAVAFALLVALTNAIFTLWDKFALRTLSPFTYMYAYTALVAAGYVAYILRRYSAREIAVEWRARRSAIVQVGIFNTISYLLALAALRTGISSYVVGVRQLSIAFGVLLGFRLLGEPPTLPRRTGAALIVSGCLMVSLAR